jgi:hypothetical protein
MSLVTQTKFTCKCGKKKPLADGVMKCGCGRTYTVADGKATDTSQNPKPKKKSS